MSDLDYPVIQQILDHGYIIKGGGNISKESGAKLLICNVWQGLFNDYIVKFQCQVKMNKSKSYWKKTWKPKNFISRDDFCQELEDKLELEDINFQIITDADLEEAIYEFAD